MNHPRLLITVIASFGPVRNESGHVVILCYNNSRMTSPSERCMGRPSAVR